jgi:hypothetical protein
LFCDGNLENNENCEGQNVGYDCDGGTCQEILINVTGGAAACTCENCSILCGTCDLGALGTTDYYSCKEIGGTFTSYCESADSDTPSQCLEIGFYDSNASFDHCLDDNGVPHADKECTSDYDCVVTHSLGDNARCGGSCMYHTIGCMDDGTLPANTPNNQGGTGSVLGESYKCENADGVLYDFGNDSSCEITVNGATGACRGNSGEWYITEYTFSKRMDFKWN